jgi:hypothetical protein
VVVAHVPSATRSYIGSPSIAVLPDGTYLASHDLFGPATKEHVSALSRIYRSTDRGATWARIAEIDGAFWSTLFEHRGAVYLVGTTAHHGNAVIRRSTDGGRTWTTPADGKSGLLLKGQYHCAPVPVLVHKGRLWRAFEDAGGGTEWGKRYRAMMLSCPLDADLLDSANWTASNFIARDAAWLNGKFNAWLEGNAVADPAGNVVDVLRVDLRPEGQTAAIVRISDDGRTATFDPAADFVKFPGGATKFTIRHDAKSGLYWTLSNDVPPHLAGTTNAAGIRNMLVLANSPDLRNWTVRCVLVYHPDRTKHGFQYPDWQFDGDDLIALVRTAYDEPDGTPAHNFHDANFLTFHRIKGFRELSMKDSAPVIAPPAARLESDDFLITGYGFSEAKLATDAVAFSNRTYVWKEVPAALAGAQITQTSGGMTPTLRVRAKRDATLHVATAATAKGLEALGFTATDWTFQYTDAGKTTMRVWKKPMKAGEELPLPQTNWTGTAVVLPPQ